MGTTASCGPLRERKLNGPASCRYCSGPEAGTPVVSEAVDFKGIWPILLVALARNASIAAI